MARTRARLQSEDKNHKAVVNRNDEAAENGVEVVRKDRPTPSARDARRPGESGLIYRIPVVGSLASYFKGVVSELQKVTWPDRDETQRLTAVVLGVTAAFAIVLGLLDAFFSWWFQQAFHADSEWIFLVVAAGVAVIASGTYVAMRKYV